MKKLMSIAVAGLMVAGLAGSAWAAEGTGASDGKTRVGDLPGYQQLLDLREEGKSIREQIRQERGQIKELVKVAREEKDEDTISQLKTYRPTLQQLREERRDLRETQKNNWEEMREARAGGDQTQMESALSQIVAGRQDLNNKLGDIKAVEDQMLQVLQGDTDTTE